MSVDHQATLTPRPDSDAVDWVTEGLHGWARTRGKSLCIASNSSRISSHITEWAASYEDVDTVGVRKAGERARFAKAHKR